jgi:hypothetical protein
MYVILRNSLIWILLRFIRFILKYFIGLRYLERRKIEWRFSWLCIKLDNCIKELKSYIKLKEINIKK